MPRKNKPNTELENGIPFNPADVKQTTEIPVKTFAKSDIEKIEIQGTKPVKKQRAKRKTAEKKEITSAYNKKPAGTYTLIITEKPQAALKIASALSNDSYKQNSDSGVPYYEFSKDGKKIIVACAAGHLLTLVQDKDNNETGKPIFNLKWQANHLTKKSAWSKKYYQVLAKLVKNASDFVIATDYDIEGEVIGWNILRFIAKHQDAKRMKYSTLTTGELKKSFENLMPTLDWGQAIAGETRHYLDWMYGINLSRELMNAVKSVGKFRIFSIGRVQGPALNLVVKKEISIQKFKSETYWQVFILIEDILLKYIKDIKDKKLLEKFQQLKDNEVNVTTEKFQQSLPPPVPFDLTTLQTEAYKFFNINPARTLQIAQQLYLSGLISYPRTSSQKIPEIISPKDIIKKLSKKYKETSYCTRQNPIEGKKSDPAHPSIYPTGDFQNLTEENEKIYDLVVRRFLSCFCKNAEIENKTITATTNDKNKFKFVTRGIQIKEKNWLNVYKAKLVEKEIPDLNGTYKIKSVNIEEKQTQPPKRYTPASLVRELEKRNLGTKATRSTILETLYNRGYIKGQSIEATPLGMHLIASLEKYSPIIIDEALTRQFEKEMDEIQLPDKTKQDLEKKEEKVINEAKKMITEISEEFQKNQEKIGNELVKGTEKMHKQNQEENTLQQCPVCKKGNLRILFNRASKRSFVACSNYPECKNTYTLPYGFVKKTGKTCEHCGFPKLLLIKKARRPWEFCFNPSCPGRKQNSETSTDK